ERTRHPEIEYIFKHALTQEVAYNSLLAPRRKELHRRVGDAMESLFAERLSEFHSLLAPHFLRGEVWDKAAFYYTQAGDAAARLSAQAEARRHYTHILEALAHFEDTEDTRRQRVDTLIKLVSCAMISDSPDQNLARLAEAEELARSLPGP